MIRIKVGGDDLALSEAAPEWISQAGARRQSDGMSVRVRVQIETDGVQLSLATPGCNASGRSRELTRQEEEVIGLWLKHRLSTGSFGPGDVVAFVKQLKGLLGI